MATVDHWERYFYRPNVIECVEVEGEGEKAYTLSVVDFSRCLDLREDP